jgi:REP element-mobilizing transposase RayT
MPINFQAYNSHAPLRIYRRALPHWRQDGATYFVTCRLADSLPGHLVAQLEQLRKTLLAHADEGTACLQADREYFRKMKGYLDMGHGACWLKQAELAELVNAACRHFDGGRYELGEASVMPNHTHILVRPLPGYELEDILHSWKSYTARQINAAVGRTGSLWQEESYHRLVRDSLELSRTERYIRNNALPPEKRETGW